MGQIEGAIGAHSRYQTQVCFHFVGSRESISGEAPFKQISKDELGRLEHGMRRGFQAEHPAGVWLIWLKRGPEGPNRESVWSWKKDVVLSKEFGFYPSGSGRPSKGLPGQVCIPQVLLQLLCRLSRRGRGARRTAIWKAVKPRQGRRRGDTPKG